MGRRGGGKVRNPNKRPTNLVYEQDKEASNHMVDDEIDAFHKQRDIVPLDINDNVGESDEDDEHPVFDLKDADDDEEDSDDEDEDMEDDTGIIAKMARQQKFLRAKVGGVEDEMHDDAEEEEEQKLVWGRRKDTYYNAENVHYELQSSDEELLEEEAEVLRLQKEKAKSFLMEDFGLEDVSQDESDGEPTLEEILVKGKSTSEASADKEAHNDPGAAYEEVKKDLNALSKEEQMEVVYSSAPELVGLLSELNDALKELENKVNPVLSKVKEGGSTMTGGMHYMEVKQLLLLAYCQAITFYLLLKSDGQPVRDHPVIARLVETKNLLDKIKQLDVNLPSELEDILNKKHHIETVAKLLREDVVLESDSFINNHTVSVGKREATVVPHEAALEVKLNRSLVDESKGRKRKHPNDQIGAQSTEMLKARAALEENLKQKGILGSIASKPNTVHKRQQLMNGQFETRDDFDDDATYLEGSTPGTNKVHATSMRSSKLSQLVTQINKPKFVSGDDDLPRRDDIGERRRKHELRVLAGAGIKSVDDVEDETATDLESNGDTDMEEGGKSESDDEFYKQVEQQRAAKLAAKSKMHGRTTEVPSMPNETLVDGKRHISYQMEKNRGLTRARNKKAKNPRKNYKNKHEKAKNRRKGQVPGLKKQTGSYGGEVSGINPSISKSIRFKN